MTLIELIAEAFLLILFLSIPIGIVLSIIDSIIRIKCYDLYMQYRFFGGSCWGMKPCGHPNCRLRYFCLMYQHAITTETVAELESMLEERHKELEMEGKQ